MLGSQAEYDDAMAFKDEQEQLPSYEEVVRYINNCESITRIPSLVACIGAAAIRVGCFESKKSAKRWFVAAMEQEQRKMLQRKVASNKEIDDHIKAMITEMRELDPTDFAAALFTPNDEDTEESNSG